MLMWIDEEELERWMDVAEEMMGGKENDLV